MRKSRDGLLSALPAFRLSGSSPTRSRIPPEVSLDLFKTAGDSASQTPLSDVA